MALAACPSTSCLEALIDELGTDDESDELLRHLETCPDCQHKLESLAAEPVFWNDTAHGLGDNTRHEGALLGAVRALRSEITSPAYDEGLPFLRASDRPGVLGFLGPYEVLQVIGHGGMGIVLKAFDPALTRMTAIKVMAPFLATSARARRRFVREGRAAAAVAHEHIVTVYGVDEVERLPYLVMQWIDGESLQQHLDRAGPLPVADVIRFGEQIASGLAAAHAQGLIHRDIKPANILLEAGQRVKITDFGLARMADEAGVTQDGVVAGTPEYMAPEQARGEAVDHRADLFSLGSVLYALASGQAPFKGAMPLAVLRQVCDETARPLRSLDERVPAWLETVIRQLHAKSPDDRIQSASELAGLFADYGAHLRNPDTFSPPRLTQAPRPRRRFLFRMTALVCLVALAAFWATQGVPEPEKLLASEYSYDFRNASPLPTELRMIGPEAARAITHEQEGLRIQLTEKHAPNPVGIAAPLRAHGNFEITVSYDLLKAEKPLDQGGVGFELYVATDSRTDDAIAFYRTNRAHDGDGYYCNRITTLPDLGRRYVGKHFPGDCKAGQLRLTRSASEATFWVAEGGGPFREIFRCELGPEDVKAIYVRAFPGKPANAVDVRIKDIRVRSESFAERPRGGQVAVVPAGPGATRWKVWALLAVVLTLVVGGALVAWRNRRPAAGLAPVSEEGGPGSISPEESAPVDQAGALDPAFLFLKCSGCARKLKCKEARAGKKIKCAACGQEQIVRAND